jgi:hypothetical protein
MLWITVDPFWISIAGSWEHWRLLHARSLDQICLAMARKESGLTRNAVAELYVEYTTSSDDSESGL